MPDQRRPIPREQLIANARGLAFAAFADAALIARLLGISEREATGFQETAIHDWHGLMAEARRVRRA